MVGPIKISGGGNGRLLHLRKKKLGTLIAGENGMDNEQLDPSPWFEMFKSVRFFFFSPLTQYIARCQGGLSTGSLPVQRSAIIPRYCCARLQTQGPVVSWQGWMWKHWVTGKHLSRAIGYWWNTTLHSWLVRNQRVHKAETTEEWLQIATNTISVNLLCTLCSRESSTLVLQNSLAAVLLICSPPSFH